MKLAFYAPLKPPDHPTPSGDRTMARALMTALAFGGHEVQVASTLRSRDGAGSAEVQAQLQGEAIREIDRLTADPAARDWQAWVTYHNYYKAPDLIGPAVSRALGIPYVLIEATRAKKRLEGAWSEFAHAAEAACDAAGAICYLTMHDEAALRRDAPAGQRLVHLKPFIARTDLPPESTRDGPILTVGMMRPGDKLASYQLVSDTLAHLAGADWRLDIAGDGTARDAVEHMMAPYGAQVQFLGRLSQDAMAERYAQAQAMFWPGVNEAFGLVYLEAQAAGVPVIAQDRPGVRDVLCGTHPRPKDGPEPMAAQLARYMSDRRARDAAGRAARDMIAHDHLLGSAARTLTDTLEALV